MTFDPRQGGAQLPTPPLSPILTGTRPDRSKPYDLKGIGSWVEDPHPYVKDADWSQWATPQLSKKDKKKKSTSVVLPVMGRLLTSIICLGQAGRKQDKLLKARTAEWVREWVQDDFRLPPSGHGEHLRASQQKSAFKLTRRRRAHEIFCNGRGTPSPIWILCLDVRKTGGANECLLHQGGPMGTRPSNGGRARKTEVEDMVNDWLILGKR
jgi:hypothetical protein